MRRSITLISSLTFGIAVPAGVGTTRAAAGRTPAASPAGRQRTSANVSQLAGSAVL